jgi:exodeoxyribonuclease VII large subunit
MMSVVPASSTVLTVSEALAMSDRALGVTSAGEVWVSGEISGLQRTASGRLYCTLHGDGGRIRVCAMARDACRLNDRLQAVNVTLGDGQAVRLKGRLGCAPATGVVELRVTGVDPAVTVGATELNRRRLRQRLIAAELIGRQRALVLPPFPQRILLIGPDGALAEEFLAALNQSPWKWSVTFMPTKGDGLDTPEALAGAVERPPDSPQVIVLARRSSAASAAYDSDTLARAVCTAAVPVMSAGAGGGQSTQSTQSTQNRAIVDECAWAAVATPAAAAELLNQHMVATSDRIVAKRDSVLQAAKVWTARNQAEVDDRLAAIRQAATQALAVYRVAEAEKAVRRAHAMVAVAFAALAAVLIALVVMGGFR